MATIDTPAPAPKITAASVPAIGRGFRLQWEKAQNAYVLLYAEGMVTLNGSAGAILALCDGKRTVAAIVDELQRTYGQSDLGADVSAFLRIAIDNKWVQYR